MANYKARKGMTIDVQPLKTQEEMFEMLDALAMSKNGQRDQLLFKLGVSTGLRIGDLVTLKISDVKKKTQFKIREGKTKKERVVYLNAVLADLIEYLETLDANEVYLFPSRKGGHISKTQAYRILRKAGELIGNDSIGTHTLRKTFGYIYYKDTKDIATLMHIFNHADMAVTMRYIGITEESVEQSLKTVQFFKTRGTS